jgi:hypothetical protein
VIDVVAAPADQATVTMTQLGNFLRFLCRSGAPTRRSSIELPAHGSYDVQGTSYIFPHLADAAPRTEEDTTLWADIDLADFEIFAQTLGGADNLDLWTQWMQ